MDDQFELTVDVRMSPDEQLRSRARLVGRTDGLVIPLSVAQRSPTSNPSLGRDVARRFPVVLAREWQRWRTVRKAIARRRLVRETVSRSAIGLRPLGRAPRRRLRRSHRRTSPNRLDPSPGNGGEAAIGNHRGAAQ
jgi:hypothetical protein